MVVSALSVQGATLAIFAGALGAIIYALHILVLLERKMARIDLHIELLVKKVLKEEIKIEKDEASIKKALSKKSVRKK